MIVKYTVYQYAGCKTHLDVTASRPDLIRSIETYLPTGIKLEDLKLPHTIEEIGITITDVQKEPQS